ncbi:hypothetical protein B566_EDAN014211 [Ephemera danica]|nr:hypothetical protein B566_EDAN014211 [Ephemera danica]
MQNSKYWTSAKEGCPKTFVWCGDDSHEGGRKRVNRELWRWSLPPNFAKNICVTAERYYLDHSQCDEKFRAACQIEGIANMPREDANHLCYSLQMKMLSFDVDGEWDCFMDFFKKNPVDYTVDFWTSAACADCPKNFVWCGDTNFGGGVKKNMWLAGQPTFVTKQEKFSVLRKMKGIVNVPTSYSSAVTSEKISTAEQTAVTEKPLYLSEALELCGKYYLLTNQTIQFQNLIHRYRNLVPLHKQHKMIKIEKTAKIMNLTRELPENIQNFVAASGSTTIEDAIVAAERLIDALELDLSQEINEGRPPRRNIVRQVSAAEQNPQNITNNTPVSVNANNTDSGSQFSLIMREMIPFLCNSDCRDTNAAISITSAVLGTYGEVDLSQTMKGYLLTPQGISVDPSKIATINAIKRPENIKQIQQFIGKKNEVCDVVSRLPVHEETSPTSIDGAELECQNVEQIDYKIGQKVLRYTPVVKPGQTKTLKRLWEDVKYTSEDSESVTSEVHSDSENGDGCEYHEKITTLQDETEDHIEERKIARPSKRSDTGQPSCLLPEKQEPRNTPELKAPRIQRRLQC